ncbi:MAG: hypothetical protein ABID79_04760 [Elusimicrobiota bacterium]
MKSFRQLGMEVFWKKRTMAKKVIAATTAAVFLWMQIFVPSARLFAVTSDINLSGGEGATIYIYNGGHAAQGLNLKTGELTKFVAGKIDYIYRIGTDGKEFIVTDFDYDDLGRLTRITDVTSKKYIEYGEIKNSKNDVVGWGAIKEYDKDDKEIGNYVYNDEGQLLKKELFSKIDANTTIQDKDGNTIQTLTKNKDGYYKTGEILYVNGKPSKEITFLELGDHDNDPDTLETFIYWGKEGRVSKTWEHDAQGKLISSKEFKLHYKDTGKHKEDNADAIYEREIVEEETTYDEDEKSASICRNGEKVGSFEYDACGRLSRSVYKDADGLTTTTTFDKYERAESAITEGQKLIWVDAGDNADGGKYQQMTINIKTETTYKYNDTSEAITTKFKDAKGNDITAVAQAGGLISKSTVNHSWGSASFAFTQKMGCGKKMKGFNDVVVDNTTRTAEYFNNGEAVGVQDNSIKSENKSGSKMRITDKGSMGWFAALIALIAIIVVAVIVTMITAGTALPALSTIGSTLLTGLSAGILGVSAAGAVVVTASLTTVLVSLAVTALVAALVPAIMSGIEATNNGCDFFTGKSKDGDSSKDRTGFNKAIKDTKFSDLVSSAGFLGIIKAGVDTYDSLKDLEKKEFKVAAPKVQQPNYANRLYEQISIRPPVEPPKNLNELRNNFTSPIVN